MKEDDGETDGHGEVIEMLGSRLEVVTTIDTDEADVVVMRTTMAPGRGVPLHSHSDFESFQVVSGEVQFFVEGRGWRGLTAGASATVAHGERHAIRNVSDGSAELIVITNNRLASFFREAAVGSGAPAGTVPSPEAVMRVRAAADRYGYWMSGPEENAAIAG